MLIEKEKQILKGQGPNNDHADKDIEKQLEVEGTTFNEIMKGLNHKLISTPVVDQS